MQLDLEITSLVDKNPNHDGNLDTLSANTKLPSLIVTTISQINELKRKRDRLSLTLRERINAANFKDAQISQQISDLVQLRKNIDQAALLQENLLEEKPLPSPKLIASAASPALQVWYGKVYDAYHENVNRRIPENSEVNGQSKRTLSFLSQ